MHGQNQPSGRWWCGLQVAQYHWQLDGGGWKTARRAKNLLAPPKTRLKTIDDNDSPKPCTAWPRDRSCAGAQCAMTWVDAGPTGASATPSSIRTATNAWGPCRAAKGVAAVSTDHIVMQMARTARAPYRRTATAPGIWHAQYP